MRRIQFRCPDCECSIKVEETLMGRTVQCPECAIRVIVPRPGPDERSSAQLNDSSRRQTERESNAATSRQGARVTQGGSGTSKQPQTDSSSSRPKEKIRRTELRINRDAKNLPMICSVCGTSAVKYEQREFRCNQLRWVPGGPIPAAATRRTAYLLLPVCERHTRKGGPAEKKDDLKYGLIGIACFALLVLLIVIPLPTIVKAIGSSMIVVAIGVVLYLGTARLRERAKIKAIEIASNAIILDGVSEVFAESMQDHVDDPDVTDFLRNLENSDS